MGIFEDIGVGIDGFFKNVSDMFTPPKHPNCKSAKIHPIFMDGKVRYLDVKATPVYPDEPVEKDTRCESGCHRYRTVAYTATWQCWCVTINISQNSHQ